MNTGDRAKEVSETLEPAARARTTGYHGVEHRNAS